MINKNDDFISVGKKDDFISYSFFAIKFQNGFNFLNFKMVFYNFFGKKMGFYMYVKSIIRNSYNFF